MRIWISDAKSYTDLVKSGDTRKGMGVDKVIYSKGTLKSGDIVMGMLNWQKYCLIEEKNLTVLPKDYPNPEVFLGVYGLSGLTAYFRLFDMGKIQKGETVVVSAAAGAVGEIVIQLARNFGCKVIGIASGP
jgi:NADPH-dependent curcumin reductase CurA